jgi:hypothetical protein
MALLQWLILHGPRDAVHWRYVTLQKVCLRHLNCLTRQVHIFSFVPPDHNSSALCLLWQSLLPSSYKWHRHCIALDTASSASSCLAICCSHCLMTIKPPIFSCTHAPSRVLPSRIMAVVSYPGSVLSYVSMHLAFARGTALLSCHCLDVSWFVSARVIAVASSHHLEL